MKNKLVIVTDLGLLKAYRVDVTLKNTPRLEPMKELVFEEAHRRFAETVTDMAGRHVGPSHPGWGAPMTDDHNLRLETERRLIKRIARHIEELVHHNGQAGVWLAAHKEINHPILDELAGACRARIEKNLTCDLIKANEKELLEHFLET
jgi:hypothetical protein